MAASITEAGYGAVYKDVRIGMKENDVQGIMIKAIYEAGGEYEEGWVVNAGDRTNPRSFNWSDRPLSPGNSCPWRPATSIGAAIRFVMTDRFSWEPNRPIFKKRFIRRL